MRLSLKAHERESLIQVAAAMASPLAFPDVQAWQSRFLRALKPLTGADKASLLLPASVDVDATSVLANGAAMFSEDISTRDLSVYPSLIHPLDGQWSVWERQSVLGAWTRDLLWHGFIDTYEKSSYYLDYIVPGKHFDPIGLMRHLDGPAIRPSSATVAGVWLHHARPTGRRFGARGHAMLQLLYPAFCAGVETLSRLGKHRESFVRTVDSLALPLAIFDEAGRCLHRTPSMLQLLACEPEPSRLLAKVAEAAAAVLGVDSASPCRRGAIMRAVEIAPVTSEVHTVSFRYRVRSTMCVPDTLGRQRACLVMVERKNPTPWTDEGLRDQFSLTAGQIRVARLLAAGGSVGEIAAQLNISTHTARRHVEALRAKLGTRSIAGIVAAVNGPRAPEMPDHAPLLAADSLRS